MNNNTDSDNWGQLLSEFGIEDNQTQKKAEKPKEPPAAAVTHSGAFGTNVNDSEGDIPEESQQPKEKKSIFSRFPKINFFGAPPEVSLDSVIEGVKSPSLGGKAFTDNKLEKMPVSQERTDRHNKNRREKENTDKGGAWSAVASQIDVLASGGDTRAQTRETKTDERPARRAVSSMFDDPIPESEEIRALKDLMKEPPRREEKYQRAFLEEESGSHQRGDRKPVPEEKETRGRGSRYKPPVEVDDLSDSDFEPVEEEMPKTRGRGQRGSKYAENTPYHRKPVQEEGPQEEWSEVDAALQAGRGGRHPRYEKRRKPERSERQERPEKPVIDREPLSDGEENNIVAIHGNVPSWDDAIGDILAGNIARHKGQGHSGHSNRGRR